MHLVRRAVVVACAAVALLATVPVAMAVAARPESTSGSPSAGHVYWTRYGGGLPGSIGRANLDGTDVDQDFITASIVGGGGGGGQRRLRVQ